MSLKVSKRRPLVAQSEIRNMTLECARVGGVNLAQGVCDLPVPQVVMDGANEAMADGYNIYTRFDGLPRLRQAIADKQKKYTGMDVDPERQVMVSAGATGAFYAACLALLDEGDEVIVFEPYYGYHIVTMASLGIKPVYVTLEPPNWEFCAEDLEKAVTAKTRAIILNTPSNPAGKVFDREELTLIADFAQAHDIFVFTDEIYEHFVYDGLTHISPATLPGMARRTITMSGLSKVFAITGWRLGYAICDPEWALPMGHFNDLVYVCAASPLQIGAAKGMEQLGSEYYQGVSDDHQMKRDLFCDTLRDIGLTPHVPKGAYYTLADVTGLPGRTAKESALYLLEKTGVACVPGSAFYGGPVGETMVRFCFAKEMPILQDAMDRLRKLA
ncbi:pyridoxal phosphate-dependent aminotransferase [Pseudodesulfovibrio sediminis]|uniref:Aminotransferase n=1 Tax=Pseudodesulfovibrio sediminis TaxID=2810563 RepID=A0ABM7P6J3_9BACT|nr:pyridoxal phosphate-dependent aminotransferase [Pseudodesulfovibrio sediminis]BCS88548.1 aminotransferase [Pseudodesulfovibrio sediminis]